MLFKNKSPKNKFRNIYNGFLIGVKEESSIKVLVVSFFVVLFFSFYFKINKFEFLLILIISAMVFLVEFINTAIENICDHITLDEHENIKRIKDISSTGVFLTCFFALILGIFIFIPYIFG